MEGQMETKEMTIKEVMRMIINDLGSIEVLMKDYERYGVPIARAIMGLNEVYKFMESVEAQAMQATQDEPEVKLELVSAEETNNADT